MNAQRVRNLATPILTLAARDAGIAGLTAIGNEFLANLAHGLRVDAVVDGLLRLAQPTLRTGNCETALRSYGRRKLGRSLISPHILHLYL